MLGPRYKSVNFGTKLHHPCNQVNRPFKSQPPLQPCGVQIRQIWRGWGPETNQRTGVSWPCIRGNCGRLMRLGRLFLSCRAGFAVQIHQLWRGWGPETNQRTGVSWTCIRGSCGRARGRIGCWWRTPSAPMCTVPRKHKHVRGWCRKKPACTVIAHTSSAAA